MPKTAIHNPNQVDGAPGKSAYFSWAGSPYEIKPGETVMLDDFLVHHARKHNPWLKLMEESMGALSFAESQVKMAEERVGELSSELAAKTAELKRAQTELLSARTRLKNEQSLHGEKEAAK